jgi:hypothetical protein
MIKPLVWAVFTAMVLRFGLEPLAWLFYEIHFALDVTWLYWGYSFLRGAHHLLGLWRFGDFVYVGAFSMAFLMFLMLQRRESINR